MNTLASEISRWTSRSEVVTTWPSVGSGIVITGASVSTAKETVVVRDPVALVAVTWTVYAPSATLAVPSRLATLTGDEHGTAAARLILQVTLVAPPDGNYQAWVHGFAVAGSPTFPLRIDAVQGNDLTVTGLPAGAVPAGTPVVIHVDFSKTMTSGQNYKGELQLGPPAAPTALSIPIQIHRN